MIIYGFVALILYDLYLFVDPRLTPDTFQTALLMRLGVVTSLALAIVMILRFNPPVVLRESMEAGITVIVTASILWLMLVSQSPLRIYHHFSVVLVILFANVVQRIRFWYAVAASLGSFALYAVVDGGDAGNPRRRPAHGGACHGKCHRVHADGRPRART